MKPSTLARLDDLFVEMPVLVAGSVKDSEIDDAEQQIGAKFVSDYRQFIARYGGAMVGSSPVFGLRQAEVMGDDFYSVTEVTAHFRRDGWPGTEEWIVVSMDATGNPIGINNKGELWLSDHDSGDIARVACSFEEFVERLLDESDLGE